MTRSPDQEDSMEPEENQYEMVMPFVAVSSHGGPFDDDAFVAGAEFAACDERLKVAVAVGLDVRPRYYDPRLIPQLDLLAMRHGFVLTSEELDPPSDEWRLVRFERPESPDA